MYVYDNDQNPKLKTSQQKSHSPQTWVTPTSLLNGITSFFHVGCKTNHMSSEVTCQLHHGPMRSLWIQMTHQRPKDLAWSQCHIKFDVSSSPLRNTILWYGYFTQGFGSFQTPEMPEALNTRSFSFTSNVSEGTSKDWATASITDSCQGFHKRAITPWGSIARVRMTWHTRNPQPRPEVFFGNF